MFGYGCFWFPAACGSQLKINSWWNPIVGLLFCLSIWFFSLTEPGLWIHFLADGFWFRCAVCFRSGFSALLLILLFVQIGCFLFDGSVSIVGTISIVGLCLQSIYFELLINHLVRLVCCSLSVKSVHAMDFCFRYFTVFYHRSSSSFDYLKIWLLVLALMGRISPIWSICVSFGRGYGILQVSVLVFWWSITGLLRVGIPTWDTQLIERVGGISCCITWFRIWFLIWLTWVWVLYSLLGSQFWCFSWMTLTFCQML